MAVTTDCAGFKSWWLFVPINDAAIAEIDAESSRCDLVVDDMRILLRIIGPNSVARTM